MFRENRRHVTYRQTDGRTDGRGATLNARPWHVSKLSKRKVCDRETDKCHKNCCWHNSIHFWQRCEQKGVVTFRFRWRLTFGL